MDKPVPIEDKSSAQTKRSAQHDAWFRAKVQEALDDPRPGIPHEQVKAHFAKRREAALAKKQSS
jgi:DNA-damage-inducible protein J